MIIISLPLNNLINRRGELEDIRALLEEGADANGFDTGYDKYVSNNYAIAPLHCLCMNNDILLATQEYVTSRQKRNQQWYNDVADLLIEYGADLNLKAIWNYHYGGTYIQDRSTPIEFAAKVKSHYGMRALFRHIEPSIEIMLKINTRAFGTSVRSRSMKCVQAFLDNRVVLTPNSKNVNIIASFIASRFAPGVVLVAHYAKLNPDLCDVNMKDYKGKTALHYLARVMGENLSRDEIMFEALIGGGANPTIPNNEGQSPAYIFFNKKTYRNAAQEYIFEKEMTMWIAALASDEKYADERMKIMEMLKKD